MTTKMNLNTSYVRRHKLTDYKTESQEKVRIDARIYHWFLVEEGVAPRGAKKERQEMGEVPESVIVSCSGDNLEFQFTNSVRLTDSLEPRISLDYLAGLARLCKRKHLDYEEAYEYFHDQIYKRNSREVGWNQYEIDERKDKVIDIGLRRFRE